MRKFPLVPGQYYHIYNRGVNKEKIFFNPQNWHFFLNRLRQYCTSDYADVIVYCLMPNHYHLLVHIKSADFGLKVMHSLTISYTKAINQQQNRSGHLFQGPYQTQLIEKNEYLLHLSRYIHLNPVTARLVKNPQEWQFSSYRDYISGQTNNFINPDIILEQFPSTEAYEEFVCNPIDDIKLSGIQWIEN